MLLNRFQDWIGLYMYDDHIVVFYTHVTWVELSKKKKKKLNEIVKMQSKYPVRVRRWMYYSVHLLCAS